MWSEIPLPFLIEWRQKISKIVDERLAETNRPIDWPRKSSGLCFKFSFKTICSSFKHLQWHVTFECDVYDVLTLLPNRILIRGVTSLLNVFYRKVFNKNVEASVIYICPANFRSWHFYTLTANIYILKNLKLWNCP